MLSLGPIRLAHRMNMNTVNFRLIAVDLNNSPTVEFRERGLRETESTIWELQCQDLLYLAYS